MVKNGQFEIEKHDDSVKIHYDYGELVNSMKWKDEYSDNPPQYIEKESHTNFDFHRFIIKSFT